MMRSSAVGLAARLFALLASLFCAPTVFGQPAELRVEAFYQQRFCEGLRWEVHIGQQRRADCVSETHAIEIVFHDKWKEGIGHVLAYSADTALIPGIALVCRSDQGHCLASSLFVRRTLGHHKIKATLWDCLPMHLSLSHCKRWDIDPQTPMP
jgi:hypothetical protein